MKSICYVLFLAFLFTGCAPPVDNSANEAFEKNKKTILTSLENWENEKIDYSHYASDFVRLNTGYGDQDSLSLDEMKEGNQKFLTKYDFKLVTDPVILLPGVDGQTGVANGSVRHYPVWEITRPATDSTAAKSAEIKLYQSYDFNADGKITLQVTYGDFGGFFEHLNSDDEGYVAEAKE